MNKMTPKHKLLEPKFIKCKNCGKEFNHLKHLGKVYCSEECNKEANTNLVLTMPKSYKKRLREHVNSQNISSISEWLRKIIDKENPLEL